MARILASLCLVLAATLSLATAASAGAWAVTTIDSFPETLVAGERYDVSYTIRQHGITPVDVETAGGTTEIRGTSDSGGAFAFRGEHAGTTGRYTAKIAIPAAGAWTLEVTQGPFAPQRIGVYTVALPRAAASAGSAPAAAPEGIRIALLGVTVLSTALFALMLGLYLKGARSASAAPPA